MTLRDFAKRLLGRLVLPQPAGDRTLNLVDLEGKVPAYGHRCLCAMVAWKYWRTAHENGCNRIVVHNVAHKHEFDTIDLYRKVLGVAFVPAVQRVAGRVPRFLATRGHEALGDTLDTTRPTFNIPLAVCGPTTASKEAV